jgi:hypothetical protein
MTMTDLGRGTFRDTLKGCVPLCPTLVPGQMSHNVPRCPECPGRGGLPKTSDKGRGRKPASVNYFSFAVCCGVRSSTLGHNLALGFWVT